VIYAILGLATGAGIAMQAVANGRLRVALGSPIWAAVAQFLVGLAALVVLGLAMRQGPPTTGGLSRWPWWIWTGGLFGALYVTMSIVLAQRLGTALMFATIMAGQMTLALLFDHYGWLGTTMVPLTGTRVAGAVLLVAGLLLMRWT
jgi:transporter family-2 protein